MPEIQLPSLPDVEIVDQNGKHLDNSSIDNYDAFMAFLMQASIAANTAKIRKYYEDRPSKGGVQSFNLNITPTAEEIRCIYPSQSIHLINDGPGVLFFVPNDYKDTPAFLNVRGELDLNFETHKLERFYVWTVAGTTAIARVWVKY